MNTTIEKPMTKKARRAAQLLAHYATCERLAAYCVRGLVKNCVTGASRYDGKKIAVALLKLEREAHAGATALCNGEAYQMPGDPRFDFCADENAWDQFTALIEERVAAVFGGHTPAGLYVNGDARGYALKIDPDDAAGTELIEAVGMHTDWGRNGILSPEITGA